MQHSHCGKETNTTPAIHLKHAIFQPLLLSTNSRRPIHSSYTWIHVKSDDDKILTQRRWTVFERTMKSKLPSLIWFWRAIRCYHKKQISIQTHSPMRLNILNKIIRKLEKNTHQQSFKTIVHLQICTIWTKTLVMYKQVEQMPRQLTLKTGKCPNFHYFLLNSPVTLKTDESHHTGFPQIFHTKI